MEECGLGYLCFTIKCLREGEPGKWKGAAIDRYIPSTESFRYYRQMVSGRYAVWKMYGADAMIFLHNKAKVWGDINEQLLSTSPDNYCPVSCQGD